MGKIVAIDYGGKRTGIAETDVLRIIASGVTTVETPKLIAFLETHFSKEAVSLLVVGQPFQKDGNPSDIEEEILKFITRFKKRFPEIPVERVDESYSSKRAFQSMIDGGIGRKKRRDKALLDEISATIILQDYLSSI